MKKASTAAVLFATAALIAGVTSAASAAPSVNWKANTCEAFSHWEHHRTTANLDRMATDSLNVSWRYLGVDVWGLYGDVRSGSTKYIASDERYVRSDCKG